MDTHASGQDERVNTRAHILTHGDVHTHIPTDAQSRTPTESNASQSLFCGPAYKARKHADTSTDTDTDAEADRYRHRLVHGDTETDADA
eukprot:1450363-Alexandrium_andersonii.AAC.1